MAKKILIVEDSPTIVMLLTARLESCGFEVISAGNGKEGLEKMRGESPDLVVLDVRMPVMDGFETCGIAKKDPSIKNIPIIMLTTSAQECDFQKAEELGADGYLTKPYEGQALVDEINKWLKE